MAFTGFNFRSPIAGGTAFPGDPAGTVGVTGTTAYSAAQGYGFVNSTTNGTAYNNIADGRLGGNLNFVSNSTVFRIDLANGNYRFRLAMGTGGSNTIAIRIVYGNGPNDFFEISGTTTGGGTNVDATGAIVTDAAWSASPADAPVTVTRGYLEIRYASTINQNGFIKHFSYQVVPGALVDLKLPTDDSGISISTTGTTAAGSAAVSSLPNVPGVFVGMNITGPAIPAGTTVAAVGTKNAGTSNTTSLTLSSGTGVTALTAGALSLFYTPQLFDKSPANKLIAPVYITAGAANLVVTLSDGVTVNPYIKIRTYNGAPWLAYTGTVFPNTNPTHAFCIIQTDTSGNYTGSPRTTNFSLPVTYAPTKPTDGSLLSLITTPAFLQRKAVLDKQAAIKWLGYQGQAFNGGDVLVNSLTGLVAQMLTFASSAGANVWFRIRCTNATIASVAADWTTNGGSGSSNTANFFSEAGGGLLIENDAGQDVLVKGAWYTGAIRGVHFRGMKWTCTTATSIRIDYVAAKPLFVIMVTNCKFGYLFDPTYSDANYGTSNSLSQNGLQTVTGGDQLIVRDCVFWGSRVALSISACRIADIGWNVNLRTTDDFLAVTTAKVGAITVQYQGASSLSDQDCFYWFHNNSCYAGVDNANSYGFVSGAWQAPHADYMQYYPAGAAVSKMWLVFEDNSLLNNVATYASDGTTQTRYVCSRQFIISTSECNTNGVYINNIQMGAASRGLDLGAGGISYAEYNTLLQAPIMCDGLTNIPTVYIGGDGTGFTTTTGKTLSRKNVFGQPLDTGAVKGGSSEDDYIAALDGSMTPAAVNAILTGPFSVVASDSLYPNKLKYTVQSDLPTTDDNTQRTYMWAPIIPLVDAGAKRVINRLRPGNAATLTATQAQSLFAETPEVATGSYSTVTARWAGQSGNTGTTTGYDITITNS